ncbi:MAG: ABC transporter ATP-binding protein [Candidatus Doudnabacteria bacterium]|nr:ABC transporter ATP-binding protein [Candidatus Doudnabacteria bacterium]
MLFSRKEAKLDSDRNPLTYLFSKTWRYSDGNRRKVVLYWVMFIVANAFEMCFQPLVMATIFSIIQKDGITEQNIFTIYGILSLTLVIDIVFWSFHGPARCIERNNAYKTRVNYRGFLMKGVLTLPLEWHGNHHSGDTIDKVGKGTDALFSFSTSSFQVISAVIKFVISCVILGWFSPPSVVIVLVMLFISIRITMLFDRTIIAQYKQLGHAENRISESTFDAISNITTVIILRVEKLVYEAIMRKLNEPAALFRDNQRLNELKWFSTNMCCTVMAILVLGVYFWQNIGTSSALLIPSLYLLGRYLQDIGERFFQFTEKYSEVLQQKAKVLNSEELSDDFKPENFTNHVLPGSWQKLEISDLSFSYPAPVDEPSEIESHLDNISFELIRGKRYAFVGESGSGKTTLLKVIRDLYHPRSLKLSVDGRVIPDGFAGISRAIALVPQLYEIFATTIWENITVGAEYTQAFVCKFTDMACFTGVVLRLPNGFQSSVQEKGVNLSGGQQQRAALARGLLACDGKDIVLLDEPTSSLDTATEMRVYQNIFREFVGKTIVSSIHRLHLLPMFDEVFYFEKGRLVASGSFEELLRKCPAFRQLWDAYSHGEAKGKAV